MPFADIELLDHDDYESLKDADELTDKNIEMKLFVYTKKYISNGRRQDRRKLL
jgi:hypothetical protein